MKYEKPNLVGAGSKELIDRMDYPLYVFPTWMRSGKQHYVVKYTDPKAGRVRWYPGDCLVKHRAEEIFPYRKQVRRHVVLRKFVKEQSVFA